VRLFKHRVSARSCAKAFAGGAEAAGLAADRLGSFGLCK
jgi:hypothetical protein